MPYAFTQEGIAMLSILRTPDPDIEREERMDKKEPGSQKVLIPQEHIENKILFLRGHKVMLDKDLAELYGVQTKALNQAARRNRTRFPEDFIFQMTKEEFETWRSQIVTLKRGQHRKYLPHAFTEQGVAMLSSVLHSDRAIHVNIQIMRTFTKLRELMATHKELSQKVEALEKKYDYHFKLVFDAIKKLLDPPEKPKRRIGFHT